MDKGNFSFWFRLIGIANLIIFCFEREDLIFIAAATAFILAGLYDIENKIDKINKNDG